MSLTNVSWNVAIKCVHDINDPNTTIRTFSQTFPPVCRVCGLTPSITMPIIVSTPGPIGGQYTSNTVSNQKVDSAQEKIDAFDRAMGIVGK